MKVSDQVKNIRSHHAVSNHRFLNKISEGVMRHLAEKVPNLELKITAGGVTANGGSLAITGSLVIQTTEEREQIEKDVREAIDGLNNKSDLLSTLE